MKIDLTRPDIRSGVTIYREALPPQLAEGLSSAAYHLLELSGIDLSLPPERKFRASQTVPTDQLAGMENVLAGFPQVELTHGTARVNLQYPNGKQGWHQDYIPEPLVVYPQGEGFLDLAPHADTLEDARNALNERQVVSIPIGVGDVALVHAGGKIFHRGRNTSDADTRVTVVLH